MDVCSPNNLNGTLFFDACSYVRNYSACTLDSGFLNYYEWQYCAFSNRVWPTIFMFCWLITLLAAIAITADSFFAPCLVVVTKVFRMSQNLAGVTLLALGNGAPDIFSALSAVDSGNVGMAFGSIFGAGILVNTITAGVIIILRPFQVTRRPVMKDLGFYLIGILWCLFILIRRKVELWSALVLLSIYFAYVLVTAISRFLYIQYKKGLLKEVTEEVTSKKINSYEDILTLSKTEIEAAHTTDFEEENPSFLKDNEDTPLLSQRFRKIATTQFNPLLRLSTNRHLSVDTLAFRSSGRNFSLSKIPSTSHRNSGFLARIIMANEVELQDINTRKEVDDNNDKRRSKSLITPPRKRYKRNAYLSILEEERPRYWDQTSASINCVDDNMLPSSSRNEIDDSFNIDPTPQPSEDTILPVCNDDTIQGYYTEFPGMFKHFLLTIAPFDFETWKEESLKEKILLIIQSPIVFILTLSIPVVDDGAYMKGWCKILNSLHCIVSPMIWIVFFKGSTISIGSKYFLIDYLVLIIGICFFILVLTTSNANKPPIYHSCYAFLGFITSIVWIYEVANEIVNVLTVFGVVFSIPSTVLGLSVLAFANSIGDLVSNIALAKKNFPGIGYAACIGGPLFNLLVGLGLPFSLRTAKKGMIPIKLQPETVVLISTLLLVTVMNVFAVPLQRFHLRSQYGFILVALYVIFIVLVILVSLHVIKFHI